ncbi:MAG: hypothetical protein H0W03_04620 [Solirubrobacterales bacterium]|nr:hypothetical protein [Solirubrobacterales bacterium]
MLARNRAMVQRATQFAIPDPTAKYRKAMAGSVPPRPNALVASIAKQRAANPVLASVAKQRAANPLSSVASARENLLRSFIDQHKVSRAASALGALYTDPATQARRRMLESFASQNTIASIGKAQTGGLAVQLARQNTLASAMDSMRKLTAAQTGGLVAQLAQQSTVASAMDSMRRVTEKYAAATRALEPPLRPGHALMEAPKAFDVESTAVDIETARPLPVLHNYTADLVNLQREAAEMQREAAEERERAQREEVEHRRQSLAVQHAMRDALIASEEARAADAKASAEREQRLLARTEEAEAREVASAKAQAEQSKFFVKWTIITGTFGVVSAIAAVVAIFA